MSGNMLCACAHLATSLDVHLKRSANCSKIDMAAQCVGSDLAETLSPLTAESSSTNVSMHSVDSSSIQSDMFRPLPRLKLPTSTEDWNSADNAMASELVPRVCGEYNIDAAKAILVDGIYQYFSQRFGFVSVARKHRRHKSRISRQLIKLKQQKKEARKAVRLAK